MAAMFFRDPSSTLESVTDASTASTDITTPPSSMGGSSKTSQRSAGPGPTTTSTTTPSSRNRILSSFNPTQTYHIPSHGGLLSITTALPILDLTPIMRNRKTAGDPKSDRKAFKREVAEILRRRSVGEKEVVQEVMVVRRTRAMSSGMVLEEDDAEGGGKRRELIRWSVPWVLWHACQMSIQRAHANNPDVVEVWTGDLDPRIQEFGVSGASFRWRFVTPREMVLEKSAGGTGRYVVAVFYLRRGFGTTEGTLLFDERGIERGVCVASVMIALKRERQRKGVFLITV